MRYILRQKYFTIRDGFTVTNEYGQGVFRVEGKLISLGKKFRLYDMGGRELFYIKQRLFRWFKRYDFIQNGERVALIKRKPAIFCKRFKIKTDDGEILRVKGAWHSFSFHIVDENDNELAYISKKVLKIADTYTVDVQDQRRTPLIMAIAIVMDAIYHRRH